MAQIALGNVWKYYGTTRALKDLTLECEDRHFTSIVGPSGAGKTTTLKIVAGIEPVSEGGVYFNGKPVNHIPVHLRNVSMVFEGYALYPNYTVWQNLVFPLKAPIRAKKFSRDEMNKKVNQVAELLGITDLLDSKPAELSGGQRQRVSLGRTLIRDANVYLMDEPISHLDAKLRHRMRGELKNLCKVIESTIIYTSHDYKEALTLADKVAVLDKGVLQQLGTPDEIFNHPANLFVAEFVGAPPMNFIECELKRKGSDYFLRAANFKIPAPQELKAAAQKKQIDQVVIGVRPRDLNIQTRKSEECEIPSRIHTTQLLDNEKMLFIVRMEDHKLLRCVTSTSYRFTMDEQVWIGWNKDTQCIFDKNTGLNLMRSPNEIRKQKPERKK